jgi:hypothetical protein
MNDFLRLSLCKYIFFLPLLIYKDEVFLIPLRSGYIHNISVNIKCIAVIHSGILPCHFLYIYYVSSLALAGLGSNLLRIHRHLSNDLHIYLYFPLV